MKLFLIITKLLLICFYYSYSASQIPYTLKKVGITENIGISINKNIFLENYDLNSYTLDFFFTQSKPLVVFFGYYTCPMLCHYVANGVVQLLNQTSLVLGKDFNLLMLSINPNDDASTANDFAKNYLSKLNENLDGNAWYFMTASSDVISQFTTSLGFFYRHDVKSDQFAHSAAIIVLTPKGIVSRYLYGINFNPFDFKMSILEANKENVSSNLDKLLLFCYNYDPQNKTYVILAKKLM